MNETSNWTEETQIVTSSERIFVKTHAHWFIASQQGWSNLTLDASDNFYSEN